MGGLLFCSLVPSVVPQRIHRSSSSPNPVFTATPLGLAKQSYLISPDIHISLTPLALWTEATKAMRPRRGNPVKLNGFRPELNVALSRYPVIGGSGKCPSITASPGCLPSLTASSTFPAKWTPASSVQAAVAKRHPTLQFEVPSPVATASHQ